MKTDSTISPMAMRFWVLGNSSEVTYLSFGFRTDEIAHMEVGK